MFSALNGYLMFKYFEGCDPLASGKIEKKNEMVVYLVVELFKNKPGVPGLFVAAAYSGMLRYKKVLIFIQSRYLCWKTYYGFTK